MNTYKVQLNFYTDRKKRSHFKHWCELDGHTMEKTLNKFIDLMLSQKIKPTDLRSYLNNSMRINNG